MLISKKQYQLKQAILKQNENEISVLGSTQSGKTHIIAQSIIEYAQKLYEYDPKGLYNGAIIGWTTDTIKRNIVDSKILPYLEELGLIKDKDYTIKFGQKDMYFKIYNITFYFFGFNNYLSFNKILGSDLIFEWIDESAKIYSQLQLQETFDQLTGRQVSFAGHPYLKRIESFNVEGSDSHPYKLKYIDDRTKLFFEFFPFDNPKLNTEDKIRQVVNMFPPGTLREQKIFNKWVISEGRVFGKVNTIDHEDLKNYQIREIGIGIDYGSVNTTAFVPIALALNTKAKKWQLIRLETYYHDSQRVGDTPTTEYYSKQLRLFLLYLKNKYPNIPVYNIVVDSEAAHFINRLTVDNIPHTGAKKGAGSVDASVQLMQSLFYKEYLYILQTPTIIHINDNLVPNYDAKDWSLIEFESYQYDRNKSLKEGVNAYKKTNDHSKDATAYILMEWKELGKCPVV